MLNEPLRPVSVVCSPRFSRRTRWRARCGRTAWASSPQRSTRRTSSWPPAWRRCRRWAHGLCAAPAPCLRVLRSAPLGHAGMPRHPTCRGSIATCSAGSAHTLVVQVLFREDVAGRLQLEARWWGAAREGLGSMCVCLDSRLGLGFRFQCGVETVTRIAAQHACSQPSGSQHRAGCASYLTSSLSSCTSQVSSRPRSTPSCRPRAVSR
jgi:hypothetical protein